MKTLVEYIIQFSSLKNGENKFNYRLDKTFFEAFDFTDLISSNIKVELFIIKTTSLLDLKFELNGSYVTYCDKCIGDIEVKLTSNFRRLIKFGEETEEIQKQDILFIENTAYEINISRIIFEDCLLSFPVKNIHIEGECDNENIKILNQYLLIETKEVDSQNDENSNTDPRWDKLKALKNYNNKN